MHFRTAEPADVPKLVELYKAVARVSGTIARTEEEVTVEYVTNFVTRSLSSGLIVVGEDPQKPGEIISEVHGYKLGLRIFDHLLTEVTCLVHPDHQGKGVGRAMFLIFLDEIVRNRPDIGKVELYTSEKNKAAISLYQSLGFDIEGRMEMRFRSREGEYHADIPMGWINPGFEFDGDIPRLRDEEKSN